MNARKIYLNAHCDGLVDPEVTIETKAAIVGAITIGTATAPISIDDMEKAKPILDAIDQYDEALGYIYLPEDTWAFLAKRMKASMLMRGGRARLAAIHDVLNAKDIGMKETATA